MLTSTSLMPQLLWSFLPFPFQSFLFQFYPAAYKQIRFKKAVFHHVSFLLRKLLTLNFSSHQVETSLQTVMALHNQIDPFYAASFKTLLNHEALYHQCGLPFTFPNYSTDSYFLVSTLSFSLSSEKTFLLNCTLLRFQDPTQRSPLKIFYNYFNPHSSPLCNDIALGIFYNLALNYKMSSPIYVSIITPKTIESF